MERRHRIVIAICAFAALAAGEKPRDLTRIRTAIERWESNERPDALGDYAGDRNRNGRRDRDDYDAWGILQIHRSMVDDCNRIVGRDRFTYEDRMDVAESRAMFEVYTRHYSGGASDEVVARRWNGGPSGERKRATRAYWREVRAKLEEIDSDK